MRRPLPPTERLHPASRGLERLGTLRALRVLHRGDLEAVRAVGASLPALAELVELASRALGSGGRLAYVGAGTSGRLGALDAAECPPTFGVSPSRVLALVAGGARAMRRPVEGAEDDAAAGREAVRRARLGEADLVVGITASGSTPFVVAALDEARRRSAATGLVTSNPRARARADVRVVLETGPELVAGSTRMKAGSATKMALSLLSTAAMLRLGKVQAGRMIDLAPTSDKLRARAVRMVMELTGVDGRRARSALASAGWSVRRALRKVAPGSARSQTRGFGGAPEVKMGTGGLARASERTAPSGAAAGGAPRGEVGDRRPRSRRRARGAARRRCRAQRTV